MRIDMTAKEYAVQQGFYDVEYQGDYDGYRVYVAFMKELAYTGWPFFILEKDGEIKTLNTIEETGKMMKHFWGEVEE